MLFAARHGDVESARLLLAAGANVDETAPDGRSALLVATHGDHGSFATFLLEQGANPNAAAVGYAPLHAAVMTGDRDVVEALLARGARPSAQVTEATKVTRNGQVLMLNEQLLAPRRLRSPPNTPRSRSCGCWPRPAPTRRFPSRTGGHRSCWRLPRAGDTASGTGGDRVLPRELATEAELVDEEGTLAAVQTAIELGDDVNAVDEDGNTALHHVVDKGFDRVVEVLVASGANIDATNRRGLTPLAIVERARTGNTEAAPGTAERLRALGARRDP